MNELVSIKENPVVFSSKEDITGLVERYIEDVAFNGGNVIKDWAVCEKYSYLVKQLQEKLKPFVLSELEKCDRKEFAELGVDIKTVNAPAKYDFTDNPVWLEQKKVVDEATNKLKDIEAFIKGLREKTQVVTDDGEVVEFFPVTKSSSETIRTSIR